MCARRIAVPSLIVQVRGRPDRIYPLEGDEVVVGRDPKEAQLELGNVSVSRRHCRFVLAGGGAAVEDLGSQNGTLVNGTRIERHELKTGDVVSVGKFVLVYLGDGRDGQVYKGRLVDAMPRYYARGAKVAEDGTFRLSPRDAQALQSKVDRAEVARITDLDTRHGVRPGARVLWFGKGRDIPVEGVMGSAALAEISWTGEEHLIKRLSRMVRLDVNGNSVSEQKLKAGDLIRVAASRFRYD
jgi:hypothetical protein